jgi:hypothetical protein
MPDVGSHVLTAHVERIVAHHRAATEAARAAHDAHRSRPEAPEGVGPVVARPEPNLGAMDGRAR